MEDKVAIIDLGTNTFHLLVAEWREDHYDLVHRQREPAKIGMGGINAGFITEEGLQRAVSAMKEFQKVLKAKGITTIIALGTSAIRNAKNGKDVIADIRAATGIDVQVITGDQEAVYIYKGVRWAAPLGQDASLIVDIGGGSVECIIGNESEIFWKQSFETGAQRLLEKFQKHDPILKEETEALETHLEGRLQTLWEALRLFNPVVLVGSSGTFDTLSEIHCFRQGIRLPDAPETPLTISRFHEIHAELLAKDRVQRLQIPGMIEMRVDMIVPACCLIHLLLKKHPFQQIRVSAYSLKEGVLAALSEERSR